MEKPGSEQQESGPGHAMKVYSELKIASDGMLKGLRYLHTEEELRHLQKVGLIGEVTTTHGMQPVADQIMAGFERDQMVSNGGSIQ
jgi:hypothetical protein